MKIKTSALDKDFRDLIRIKRNYTCERCGKKYPVKSPGLHVSHYLGRWNKQVRWNEANVDLFCFGCHQYMETHKATEYREWKIKKLGKEGHDELVKRSQRTDPITEPKKKEIRAEIKKKLSTL